MSNTYYKMLNNKMAAKLTGDFISGIQKDLSSSVDLLNMDLYDYSKRLDSSEDIDMDVLLKYYAINQLLKTAAKEERNVSPPTKDKNGDFVDTPNKNIKVSKKDNSYYMLSEGGILSPEPHITKVYEDGTYEKTEKRKMSLYKQVNVYSEDGVLFRIQLINPNGTILSDKKQAAMILGMRKEYVQRFKYSGFSGQSHDIIAAIGNSLYTPIETGYYVDSKFHFYRWSGAQSSFIRNTKLELFSPLLTDFLVSEKMVLRKEYSGT